MNVPYIDSNDLDLRFKLNITGELWGMIRTDIMREFPFPVVEGYHFYPVYVIWHNVEENIWRTYLRKHWDTISKIRKMLLQMSTEKRHQKKICHASALYKWLLGLQKIQSKASSFEHIVAITRDGLANEGEAQTYEILTMLKTNSRRIARFSSTSPIGYLLYKHS